MIRVYLRASTKEQDATRAKAEIVKFLEENNGKNDKVDYYTENASGAKLNRPVLNQLIEESEKGDILLVEQIDRLSRLPQDEWKLLKSKVESSGLHIVSIDLSTSHQLLQPSTKGVDFTRGIIEAVNNMLLDILALTARKDFEDRRRRQAQGIEKAKEQGKYKGRVQSAETQEKIEAVRQLVEAGTNAKKACAMVGVGVATWYRNK